jgi:hypothetical protein
MNPPLEQLTSSKNKILVIRVIPSTSEAPRDLNFPDVKELIVDTGVPDIDALEQNLYKLVNKPDDPWSPFLRFAGLQSTSQPVIFLIYGQNFKTENTLGIVIDTISCLESDRYIFNLLVDLNEKLPSIRGSVTSAQAQDAQYIQFMQNIASGFVNQKRRYAFERSTALIFRYFWFLFAFPILIGLASGLGEGVMTRQVPDDIFATLTSLLHCFLQIMFASAILYIAIKLVVYSYVVLTETREQRPVFLSRRPIRARIRALCVRLFFRK